MITARTIFAILVVVVSSLVAREGFAQTVSISGVVKTYPSGYAPDAAGGEAPRVCNAPGADCEIAKGKRNVYVSTFVSRPSITRNAAGCKFCQRKWVTNQTVLSDASSGAFSATIAADTGACSIPEETRLVREAGGTWDELYCPAVTDYYLAVTATAQGSDSAPAATRGYASPPSGPLPCIDPLKGGSATVPCEAFQSPHAISPRGYYWARMFGAPNLTPAQRADTYPIFLIEGFDPGDSMASPALARFLKNSLLPNASSILDYVTDPANRLTIYVLNSGFSGGNSIVGPDTSPQGQAGMAWEAMRLIKQISVERHPGRSIVVGGYSMGGLVARTGLYQWCRGYWDVPSAPAAERLDVDCPSVSLFFSGDAPLDGALIPMAMQRFLHDPDVANGASRVRDFRQKIDSPAAREILRRSVTRSPIGLPICDTHCVEDHGCDSRSARFKDGCEPMITPERVALGFFMPDTADVRRSDSSRVPAIAVSVGPSPQSTMTTTSTSDPFLSVDLSNWPWDFDLYPDAGDIVPGSRLDKLNEAVTDGWEPTNAGVWEFANEYRVTLPSPYPTFVPSASALLWNVAYVGRQSQAWKAYWFNTAAANHAEPLPANAAAFLMSWINEYTKGLRDRPPCSDPMIANTAARSKGGSVSQCRSEPSGLPRPRICGDDICDIGEFCPADCGM